jgi:3-deoxy-D-manno-octulosonic-acid transferase
MSIKTYAFGASLGRAFASPSTCISAGFGCDARRFRALHPRSISFNISSLKFQEEKRAEQGSTLFSSKNGRKEVVISMWQY